jgi:chaperonin cofactor prefoldin
MKSVEKSSLDLERQMKVQSQDMLSMLTKAQESASEWISARNNINDSINSVGRTSEEFEKLEMRTNAIVDQYHNRLSSVQSEIESRLEILRHEQATRIDLIREELRTNMISQVPIDVIQKATLMCQKVVADTHFGMIRNKLGMNLLSAWSRETNRAIRRKERVKALVRICVQPLIKAMHRWKVSTERDALVETVKQTISETSVQLQLNTLKSDIELLRDENDRFRNQLDGQLVDLSKTLEDRCEKSIGELGTQFAAKLDELVREQGKRFDDENIRTMNVIDELRANMCGSEERLASLIPSEVPVPTDMFATTAQVKDMMKDLLLLWNNLKELDGRKVDKECVDDLARSSQTLKVSLVLRLSFTYAFRTRSRIYDNNFMTIHMHRLPRHLHMYNHLPS